MLDSFTLTFFFVRNMPQVRTCTLRPIQIGIIWNVNKIQNFIVANKLFAGHMHEGEKFNKEPYILKVLDNLRSYKMILTKYCCTTINEFSKYNIKIFFQPGLSGPFHP